MTRYPAVAREDMYSEQRRVADAVGKRRKPSASSQGGVEGPFVPLVHVPGILDRLQSLGEHCRFHTGLPAKLRELAIIITARQVAAQLEFHVHAMEAHEFGLSDDKIQAVAAKTRPENMDEDEALVHDFSHSLVTQGRVDDELFEKTLHRFGRSVIIDLITTCGYYGALGLVINVSRAETPAFLAGFKPAFTVSDD